MAMTINRYQNEMIMKSKFSIEILLAKTGGLYIMLVVAAVQLLAFPGAILGVFSIQLGADFSTDQLREISGMTPLLVFAGNLILLAVAWFMTPNARKGLSMVVNESGPRANPDQEFKAWKEITGLTWKYGAAAVPIAYLVDILPPGLYYYLKGSITQAQLGYTLTGGAVTVLGVVIFAILLMDFLLTPARLALMPSSFEAQISGRHGIFLAGKLVIIILALTLIAILMIVPIGFHNTMMALEQHGNSSQILSDIQFQSILVSSLVLLLGFGLAYFVSRTISIPLQELINTFKKVEQGDLSQRLRVTTTDEIAELTIHFNRMAARLEELQIMLEKQVYEQTAQIKATNEVGIAVSSILEPDELIKKVVNLITDRFGHYYSAIYLMDQTGYWIELIEATGDAGKVLKQNRHRLELNNKGLVASAVNNKQAMIADSTNTSNRTANPLLTYTKSEIALPLIVGDRVLGALDVQSTRDGAFDPQDIDTLQGMANQVAIALENARLYQESQKNLEELQSVQKQYLFDAWSKVPSTEKLEYNVGDNVDENVHKIEIPLALRDQSLGTIRLTTDEDISPEERILIDAVASQAAIALENARLVNESRQLANRERLVAEISNKIWTSTTIDGVMQTVVKELGRVLDTTRAVIELKSDENNE
jgi:GAF domain-containing protein/HAMP domain-containing protein